MRSCPSPSTTLPGVSIRRLIRSLKRLACRPPSTFQQGSLKCMVISNGQTSKSSKLTALKRVYSSNRAAWGNGGINNYHNRDAYNLVSLGVTLETTLDEVQKQIKAIKKDGGWLILQFHQIDNGQNEPMAFSKESIFTTKIFPEILKIILKEEVPVRTVRDIIENP